MPYRDGNPTLTEQIEEDARARFYTDDLLKEAQELAREVNKFQWRDIKTAPKDGSKILLAKYGWYSVAPLTPFPAETAPKEFGLWWAVAGFWSDRWGNWNDGVEPSGLAKPTHWMPIPELPKEENSVTPASQ